MFRNLIATTAAALLMLATSFCVCAPLSTHLAMQESDSAMSLIRANGLPDAKRIINAEGNPLKGELWVYFGADSNQEYLIRDGKVRWMGEVFRQANGSPLQIAEE